MTDEHSVPRRSPTWTREEVILVVAAVASNGWHELRTNDSRVAELSNRLRELDLHPMAGRPPNFRSTDSVSRKSSDIMTAYSGYEGTPTKGGATTREVVREFEADPLGMAELAKAVRERAVTGGVMRTPERVIDPDLGVPVSEGALREKLHLARERDSRIRKAKLSAVRAAGGEIACEVCDFNFGKTYGERGKDYIEVHHRVPLHVSGPTETALSDLALLCSNCHRMIHCAKPWLTVEQLIEIVGANRGVN